MLPVAARFPYRRARPKVMIRLLKRQGDNDKPAGLSSLGHLEIAVMEILWKQGESNVHQVAQRLERPLAYTTVMTTLDRLFKKGWLERRKSERAYLIQHANRGRNGSTKQPRNSWPAIWSGRTQPASY